jgi:hypothetical protein
MFCPSAQPEMNHNVVLGVVKGTVEDPRVGWLERPLPVTQELLAMAGPVKPAEVFRFAAQCEESACRHFDGSRCKLATRIVQILPAVTTALPPCQIRIDCRWYLQEGRAACMRCPQVVTHNVRASEDVVRAATPS